MNQTRRDPFVDFCGILGQFVTETYNHLDDGSMEKEKLNTYLEKVKSSLGISREQAISEIVKPVIRSFKANSKDILFRNGCMFTNELRMFDDIVDVSKLWRKQNADGKKIMWEFIEQLYVIGYILCYPEKKIKFLQLVKAMKNSASTSTDQSVPQEPDTHVETVEHTDQNNSTNPTVASTETPLLDTTPETLQAVNDINQMFGLQQGDVMTSMVGDIAVQVNSMMQNKSEEEQQQMFMKMINGDMSMFEGMMKNVGAQLEERIERGEIDREALEQKAQSMVGKFQGIQQQMAGMAGMGGGLEGLMGMMGGGMNPLQSPAPAPVRAPSQAQTSSLQRGMRVPNADQIRQAQQMMSQMGMGQISQQDLQEAQLMMQQMGMSMPPPPPPSTSSNTNTKKSKKDKKKKH